MQMTCETNKITFILPTLAEKIDRAIELERGIKEMEKEVKALKAELQAEALAELENKNLKYVQFFGSEGSLEAAHKVKFEVDNYDLLLEALGGLVKDKVAREATETVKYKVDARFKEALIALVNGDFARHDIAAILAEAGIMEPKRLKLALKKLKGDYKKDKAVLESFGLSGDLEEELDAIREAKNQNLIDHFFGSAQIDMDKLRRSIFVEDSLSVGLNYEA